MITDHLADLVGAAIDSLRATGELSGEPPPAEFERPRRREHGDFSTNVALAASSGGANPRVIAEAIVANLPPSDLVERVEIAGPGFLNFHLAPAWLHDVVRRAAEGVDFGRSSTGAGHSLNVEYVSANPTGPINVVSGRHAAVGDAIANLLEAVGFTVTKEFFINDAGTQLDLFAQSLAARYLQHFGRDATVPERGYHGDYLIDLAAEIVAEVGDSYVEAPEEDRVAALGETGLRRMLASMKTSLEKFGTRHDVWFSERSLHESGAIKAGIERLRETGKTYEHEGALWFRSTDYGDDKDRVLVRANGEPTYLAADVAYLLDKFDRAFEHLIYLWGADHHGTVPRLMAAVQALGFERNSVEVRLLQIVTLSTGAEALKGSKRAGVIVKLDELIEEVGADAARYTFLTRSMDAPLDFDIELAKEQAPENPVYYVQYAHARIASILRKAADEGYPTEYAGAQLDRLGHPSEEELMRKLASYEEVVPLAAETRAPQKIARFVEELASDFSAFYRDCKVLSEDAELSRARLALSIATKKVIADGLGLLGVGAPERM